MYNFPTLSKDFDSDSEMIGHVSNYLLGLNVWHALVPLPSENTIRIVVKVEDERHLRNAENGVVEVLAGIYDGYGEDHPQPF